MSKSPHPAAVRLANKIWESFAYSRIVPDNEKNKAELVTLIEYELELGEIEEALRGLLPLWSAGQDESWVHKGRAALSRLEATP